MLQTSRNLIHRAIVAIAQLILAPEETNVGRKGIEKMPLSPVRGDMYEKRETKSEKRKARNERIFDIRITINDMRIFKH